MNAADFDTEIRQLVNRVAELEAQCRRWKIGSLIVIVALAFSFGAAVRAQQNPLGPPVRQSGQTIAAQDFQLRDASGNLRGELSVANGQPRLDLFNIAGKVVWSTNPRLVAQGN